VFSPYYALARRFGNADPANHCAVNVALYGDSGKRWAMTERPRKDLARSACDLRIGSSSLMCRDGELSVSVDERTVPMPSRILGTITLKGIARQGTQVSLDADRRHFWRPLAPRARIEVDLKHPHLRWSGNAYFDRNWGEEPIEHAFRSWTWSRTHAGADTRVIYDVERRDGTQLQLARRFYGNGCEEDFEPPPETPMPPSIVWRIRRAMRSQPDQPPRVIKTFEDTPFYARSLIQGTIAGDRTPWVHESLSLDRVRRPVVRLMLPFRMPRWSSHVSD
jgi:carotenoid 1,2-hydratase